MAFGLEALFCMMWMLDKAKQCSCKDYPKRFCVIVPFIAVLLLFATDVLDLWFKTVWIGPIDSFSFRTTEVIVIDDTRSITSESWKSKTGVIMSSWEAYSQLCSEIYPDQKERIHSFLGKDCHTEKLASQDLGTRNYEADSGQVVEQMVFSASIRADSVAWASCMLLPPNLRPPLCYEDIVSEYAERYALGPVHDQPAIPDDPISQKELLSMIQLLSSTPRLHSFVCSVAVNLNEPEIDNRIYYVCALGGTPRRIALIGHYAHGVRHLLKQHAWMAKDALSALGMQISLRQMGESTYNIISQKNHSILIEESLAVDISAFGGLYALSIAIDTCLLVLHIFSAIKTYKQNLITSEYITSISNSADVKWTEQWTNVYRSLYRSPIIMCMTIVSGIVAWFDVTSVAAISPDKYGVYGNGLVLLALVRLWMVIVCIFNMIWDVIVIVISETRAYYVTQKTFVKSSEIAFTCGLVALLDASHMQGRILQKRDVEVQRMWNYHSFPNSHAYANVFTEDDWEQNPTLQWRCVFGPFLNYIAKCVIAIIIIAFVRGLYYGIYLARRHSAANESVSDSIDSGQSEGKVIPLDLDNLDDLTNVLEAPSLGATWDGARTSESYSRLPIEVLMRSPIRARSLVRNSVHLEFEDDSSQMIVLPSIVYDFGIAVQGDQLTKRFGFIGTVFHSRLNIENLLLDIEPQEVKVQENVFTAYSAPPKSIHRTTSFYQSSPRSPKVVPKFTSPKSSLESSHKIKSATEVDFANALQRRLEEESKQPKLTKAKSVRRRKSMADFSAEALEIHKEL